MQRRANVGGESFWLVVGIFLHLGLMVSLAFVQHVLSIRALRKRIVTVVQY